MFSGAFVIYHTGFSHVIRYPTTTVIRTLQSVQREVSRSNGIGIGSPRPKAAEKNPPSKSSHYDVRFISQLWYLQRLADHHRSPTEEDQGNLVHFSTGAGEAICGRTQAVRPERYSLQALDPAVVCPVCHRAHEQEGRGYWHSLEELGPTLLQRRRRVETRQPCQSAADEVRQEERVERSAQADAEREERRCHAEGDLDRF